MLVAKMTVIHHVFFLKYPQRKTVSKNVRKLYWNN